MPVIDSPSAASPGALCAWVIDTSCCTGWDEFTPEIQERAAGWATGILDLLTGQQFARCPVKIRPCGSRCGWYGGYLTYPVDAASSAGMGAPWMVPYIGAGGVWRNCTCAGPCSCRATCEAHIGGGQGVAEVLEVKVNGLVVPSTSYRLDDQNGPVLVRVDGECWPECQNLDLTDDEPDTWSVIYRPGQLLPKIGELAAGELACEFARACVGDEGCQLPSQLVSMSRNGIEVQVADPAQLLENGLTGLPNVDLFVKAVNPARLTHRPRVLTPDLPRHRRVSL
jgi:hypothetical protein